MSEGTTVEAEVIRLRQSIETQMRRRIPKPMWRSLRPASSVENLNREFRRRTKTQASFSTEEAAVTLLYGLVAFGQIQLRKIDGHRHVSELLAASVATAA